MFSILGVVLFGLFLLPTLLFIVFPPENIPPDFKKPSKLFMILEYGSFFCCAGCLFFSKYSLSIAKFDITFFVMLGCLFLYFVLFMRYYNEGQDILLLYESLFFIPFPIQIASGALLFSCSLWLINPVMIVFSVCYFVGSLINAKYIYNQIK